MTSQNLEILIANADFERLTLVASGSVMTGPTSDCGSGKQNFSQVIIRVP